MRLALPLLAGALLLAPPAGAWDADTARGVTIELAAAGLNMPVDLEVGVDGAIYYAELQAGGLRRIAPGARTPDPEPLWMAPELQTGVERGFVGLALAHDFATSARFYVFYTHNASGTITNRLSAVQDGVETRVLWDLAAEKQHNGGRILPLADGTLLVGLGDATINGKPVADSMPARDPASLRGKVLRILPDGSPAPGNPFDNHVWTMGHRNVYGLAASPDGTVIATENGPEKADEVNVLEPGADYGWPTCIGACGAAGVAAPALEYTPTIAPTGATWHRGAFYFADFNNGTLHRIYERADGTWADEHVVSMVGERLLDVAAGPDGLYITTWAQVYRVVLDERWTLEEVLPAAPSVPASPTSPKDPAPVSPPAPATRPPIAERGGTPIEPEARIPVGALALAGLVTAALARRRA